MSHYINNPVITITILEVKENFLLKKKEINKLIGKINQEGLTIIPTKMYFLKGKAKIDLAVAKGKKLYDKRQVKKNRDWNRDKARILVKIINDFFKHRF